MAFDLLRDHAAEDAQNRVTGAARSRLGGLGGIGRVVERSLPEPERQRPAQC